MDAEYLRTLSDAQLSQLKKTIKQIEAERHPFKPFMEKIRKQVVKRVTQYNSEYDGLEWNQAILRQGLETLKSFASFEFIFNKLLTPGEIGRCTSNIQLADCFFLAYTNYVKMVLKAEEKHRGQGHQMIKVNYNPLTDKNEVVCI